MPAAPATRLDLDALADRLVPSGTVHDLSTRGAEESLPSGAVVRQIDPQPTGTGYIRSFVRIQGASSGGGPERGYNTDSRPLQFDEKSGAQFTRSITLDRVPVVTVGGVAYREFLLDINQRSSSPRLSLDSVRVFLAGRGDLTGYDAAANTLAGRAAVFDLDAGGDVAVKLNAALNSGSGSGDMALLIPAEAFAGAAANAFVYLYSEFGGQAGMTANGGFEEWAVRSGSAAPATGTLTGRVNLFVDDLEGGLVGVPFDPANPPQLALAVTNAAGETTTVLATFADDGSFTFANVPAGTYTLYSPDSSLDFIEGTAAGTGGGTVYLLEDEITGVVVGSGTTVTGYVVNAVRR